MAQLVYKYDNINQLAEIAPTLAAVTKTNWSNLVMAPGIYDYNGIHYDLTQEGLYGIINIGVDGGRRIIYQNDVYALMSGLCWLSVYGRMDEGLTTTQQTAKAKGTKLSMRCGATVIWVKSVLDSLSIQNRIVNLVTGETPTNYDDGHVVIEVKVAGVWKLWDVSNNFYPYEVAHLNLNEYILNMSADKVFVADEERDIAGADNYQLNTNLIYDMHLRLPGQLDSWVDRIYGMPGIVHTDGLTYFYVPTAYASRQTWLLSLSTNYRVVSYATWLSMFY